MRTREDIEAYIIRSGLSYKELREETWILHEPDSTENIVVTIAGPLVVFRLKVLALDTVADGKSEGLFAKLLEYNAQEMVHGAYGIANGAIVLTCSLPVENLDYNEFQGTVDDFSLALSNHYETLATFRGAA